MPLYFVWGWGRRFRKGLMRKEKVTISRFFFQAQKIYHMWRKTPRDQRSVVCSDFNKGMERIGRYVSRV